MSLENCKQVLFQLNYIPVLTCGFACPRPWHGSTVGHAHPRAASPLAADAAVEAAW
jgi:hypothetical protein